MAAQVAAPTSGFSSASLYVGDLDPSVNEGQLYDLFSQVATVVSTRVCRDQSKRSSLGYAYVNFSNPQDAANAKEILNFTPINGKPIRIMFSHRDPSIRKSGYANVFIKNLDASIDNKSLYDIFVAFGTVLSCKVATDGNAQSRGFGFVQFENEEAAQNAIKRLNGMLINDKQVYVGQHLRQLERLNSGASPKFTNIYVKNLSETTTDGDLKKVFGTYGSITSTVVMKDQSGKSRCFGFVNFDSPEGAAAAVEELNGTVNDDKVWYVGRAQKKAEREAELRAKFEQERLGKYEKSQGANLYLKNLDDNIDDNKLRELFSEFGNITSCKVMLSPQGISKGSGFVAFDTPEEATKAVIFYFQLNEMNGKMIGKKPLYVAVAQRKEERKARLQAHFAQLRAHGPMAPLTSAIPGYHPAAARLGHQQLYFGQATPGLIPQPAGYGFQQQLLPGIRPGIAPNYLMPFNLQRQVQSGQRIGVRRAGNAQQMLPQQHQQPMIHHNANKGFRFMGNTRNGVDTSPVPQGIVSPIMPVQFDVSGLRITTNDAQRPGPVPISTLTSALASASPENRTVMLGEQLFPLVQRLEPEQVAKVTGMLLEMDQTEVLHLIDSPEALKEKVAEAMAVLRDAATRGPDISNDLGALALNG